jgi:tetratricopeptide (TPR) repeat protein
MTDDRPGETPTSSGNRYVLIAVLAFVALVTVLLLKKNMEPPKESQTPPQAAGPAEQMPAAGADPEQARQMALDQIDHVREILSQDSSSFDAWSALGNLYFDADMPEEAIVHYEAALKIKPDDAHVLTDLATMKREAGRPEEAVELLKHVVQIDSALDQAWFNMGVIYSFDLKDQKSALGAWKRFLALNPDSPHTDAVKQEIKRIEKDL